MTGTGSDVRFDLVVATVDRTDDLEQLLASLEDQTHRAFRVVVVDQNGDGRVDPLLARHAGLDVVRLRSPRGLSRARNVALSTLAADVVAFPDDDCVYAPDLLERVAARLSGDPELDGVCGRPLDGEGRARGRWPVVAQTITRGSVFHTAISHTIFLRRRLVESVGPFDEHLGLGSGTPWSAGEEIDYLARALRFGARVEYDPSIEITHPVKAVTREELVALGRRDGASVGYVLARNRYPIRTVARMLVRPAVGSLVSLVLLHRTRARFHAATLVGRISGLRAGSRA